MIDLALPFGFLAAASLLTVTPGVDTAIILRTATLEGRRSAMLVSIGIATGCLAWGAIASLGLSALLHASTPAYAIVKAAGGAYLIWLGVRLLFNTAPRKGLAEAGHDAIVGSNAFRQGLLVNLLNPKVGIFYLTLLPQFIPQGASPEAWSFALACMHVALALCWSVLLIIATAPLGRFLRHSRASAILDRITGTTLVGVGLSLATSRLH